MQRERGKREEQGAVETVGGLKIVEKGGCRTKKGKINRHN